jgi:Zn ribbon nucleic-acid-binding protein
MPDAVCPNCKSGDYLCTNDQLDYDVWSLNCANCGWEGTSDDLVLKEASQ